MKSSYKRLGDYIQETKVRNSGQKAEKLLGINIDKFFMPSVANIIGTDLSVYKLVQKNQFACNRMHVGRDYRLPISISKTDEEFIVSPAYDVFEIIDTSVLHPEYLMMWFSRKEFDRNAWFYTDADVRGGLPWSSFCDMQLPIPSIEKQRQIVSEYNVVQNRINLNNQLIAKLEETAQAIYKKYVDLNLALTEGALSDYIESANTGLDAIKRAPIVSEDTGIRCLRIQDVSRESNIDNWGFTKVENNNYKKFQLKKDDILIARTGATVGGNIFIRKDLKAVFNNGLIRIRADRKRIHPIILHIFFKTKVFIEHINSIAFGTSTQPNIQIGDLLSFQVSFPSIEVQAYFTENLVKIDNLRYSLMEQTNVLEKLKELLLSKLATVE